MTQTWLVLLASAAPYLAAPEVPMRPARAPALDSAPAALVANPPPLGVASLESLYESDTPPKTPYDSLEDKHTFTPEGKNLTALAFRGLAATAFVVMLIYMSMKVLLPKLINKIPNAGGASNHLRVIERMQLDATHQVFLVQVHDGPRLLLGTGGASGVQMLQSLKPAEDAFRGRMLQTPNPLPDNKDAAHAPV